jgi:anti-sigma regulatory factor (Ser/Thr protein kinase)
MFFIQVPAELGCLNIIRSFYSHCVKGCGIAFPESGLVHLVLAINEFCENIIRHGYGEGGGAIAIRFMVDNKKISTVIVDTGMPHNMLEYEPIAKETLVEKGIRGKLGIRMIKTVCNEIKYKRIANRNRTVFIKYFNL